MTKKDIETLRHPGGPRHWDILVAADIKTSWWRQTLRHWDIGWPQTLRHPGGRRHWDVETSWWPLVKTTQHSVNPTFSSFNREPFSYIHNTGEMTHYTPLRAMREVYTGVLSALVVCTNIVLHFVDFLDLWVWQLCYPRRTEGSAATRWELASTI